MTLVHRARLGALGLTAVAVAAAGTIALPAQAAAPTYEPGDVVTVNGIAVTAPRTAGSVALIVDRVDGTSQTLLVTTDEAGRVTVGDGSDFVAPAAPAGGDKCDDPAYSLIYGFGWPGGTYNWAFRKSTSPSGMTKKQAQRELKKAASNMSEAKNGCGLANQHNASNNYQGNTTQASDVTSQPACVGNPQPVNVTEFGPMGGGGILAATCVYQDGGVISDADVKINTNFAWWEGTGPCSGQTYGLRGVQTHEYGHAFGVGHVSEATSPNLTMSTNINGTCSNFEASLGQGDVLSMRDLY